MYDGHTQCVEADQTQHSPVEALRLDQAADGEADPLLFPPEVGRVFVLALHTGPGERRPWGGSWNKTHQNGDKVTESTAKVILSIYTARMTFFLNCGIG